MNSQSENETPMLRSSVKFMGRTFFICLLRKTNQAYISRVPKRTIVRISESQVTRIMSGQVT